MHTMLKLSIRALAVAVVTLLLGACESLLDTSQDTPTTTRVVVEGESAGPLRLVTSNDFFRQVTGNSSQSSALLITADTASVTPIFDQEYDLGPHTRFFVRLENPDRFDTQVTLQVFFDDELEFEESSTLEDGAMEFNFVFQR